MAPEVGTREEHLKARLALLEKEKANLREADQLAAERRRVPMVEITQSYTFHPSSNPSATVTLSDLFRGKKQLVVYHFMYSPSSDSKPCHGCSFSASNIPFIGHLEQKNTAFCCVSRASAANIETFRQKCGWDFPWYSVSSGSRDDFGREFGVLSHGLDSVYNYRTVDQTIKASAAKGKDINPDWMMGDLPGISVFWMGDGEGNGEKGTVYHTYSTYARGSEPMLWTLKVLDWTPLGRQDKPGGPSGYKYQHEYKENAVGKDAGNVEGCCEVKVD